MAQMSSEDALNGIFNILETMVAQQQREEAKSPEAKADETVISLLTGIVEKAKDKAAATVGEQLEQLAKGLTAMKEVDHDMIDHVATSIGNVNKVLSNLQVDDNTVANVEKFIDTMAKIGEINADASLKMVDFINNLQLNDPNAAMQNISVIIGTVKAMNIIASTDMKSLQENLSRLDVRVADRVGTFIKKFVDALKKANPNDEAIQKLIEPISKLMYGLSKIVSTGVWKMSISLNPIRGYLLGRQIGQFLKQIAKATKDMKVPEHVGELGKILDPLVKLADAKNKYSLWNIVKVMNPITGNLLNGFYKALVKGLNKVETHNAITAMAEILTVLFSLDNKKVVSFVSVAKTMDPKYAKQINAFIKGLIAGKWDVKKLESVKEFLEEWRKVLQSIVGSLAVVVLLAVIAPIEALVMGVGVLYFTVRFMKNIIIELVTGIKNKDVKEADKLIHEIGFTIGMFIGTVAVIALITKFVGIVPVAAGLGVLWFTLRSVKKFIIDLADKDIKENLADALKSLKGIAILVLALSVSTAIIAGTISEFGLAPTLMGLAIIAAIVSGEIYVIKKLSEIDPKNLDAASNAMLKLSFVFAIVALVSVTLLRPIGENIGDVILGGIVVSIIIGLGVFAVNKLAGIENIDNGTNALIKIAGVFALIALVTNLILIPIGKKVGDAILGASVVLIIEGLLIAGVYLLSKVNRKNIEQTIKNLAILTMIYIGIALITKLILIPIGKHLGDAMLGAAVTILITGALILGVQLLNKVKEQKILYGILATASLAIIYLGIALITKEILIPIGERTKEAALGAGVTLLIITALMVGVWLLSKVDGKTALWAILATAAIAIILLGVSLITKEILIPIGEYYDKALIGAGVVLGLIVIFGLIMFAVGKLTKSKEVQDALLRGGAIMVGIGVVLLITGALIGIFCAIATKVGENWENVLKGSGVIILLLAAMGAVMGGVGLLAKNPMVQEALVMGGVVLMGISAVMFIVGLCMFSFIPIAKKAGENWENVLKGSGVIVLLIAAIGAVMVGIGLLLTGPQAAIIGTAIAIGVAVMIGISAVIAVIASVVTLFMNTIASVMKYNEKKIKEAGSLLCTTFDVIFDVIAAAAPNPIQLVQAAAAAAFSARAQGVFDMLTSVSNAINNIVHLITVDTIHAFSQIVIGSGTDDPNSILGSLNNIITAFSKFKGVTMALIISRAIRPVIDTISQFIDVIMKVATMNYIEGYDDNGKPIYKHLPADIFSAAAYAVTEKFKEFLKSLETGFEKLGIFSSYAIGLISKSLKPVIDLVGQFVDVVMKVATGTYIIGYDDNGKPEYEHLTDQQFIKAGEAVSEQFKYFIESLEKAFSSLTTKSMDAMSIMGDVMKPIMTTVKDFVDSVIKVATLQIVTGFDKDGHPEFEQISIDDFKNAGKTVAEIFGAFIINLGIAFSILTPKTVQAMDAMKESIAPIMEGVSSFVDSILKLASGQYIDRYDKDKDGNYTVPHFVKVTKTMYENAAIVIAEQFGSFIDKITEVFAKHDSILWNKAEDALEAIGGTIGPVMEGLGTYVNAILQLATGTYVDHMEKDKDGNYVPIYKHLEPGQFKKAAKTIGRMFVEFITYFVNSITKGDFIKKAESAKDAINDSITPIMKAIKDFSEALKPFLQMTTNDKDKSAKASDYICLQPGKITQISRNIANAFVTFIGIISDNLSNPKNKEKYESIKSTAKDVQSVLAIIKKATGNLSSIIKNMSDNEGKVLDKGPAVAEQFTNVLTMFATYFQTSGETFSNAIESTKSCYIMIKSVVNISKKYADIINKIKSLDDDKTKASTFVDSFNRNIMKIATNMVQVSNTTESINFQMIRELTDTYMRIALMLAQTSDFMMQHEYMETGINKFITNVKNLTAPDFNKQMQTSAGSIKLYANRLNEFTKQIEVTTGKVEIYTTKLEAARKALADLDNQIISKEKQRNAALQHFADKINNIATAVDNMRGAFEALDENAILNRFDGIRSLLNLITGDDSDNQSNTNKTNTYQKQNNTKGNIATTYKQQQQNKPAAQQQRTNTVVRQSGMPSSGMVTFEFSNYTLQGFFRTT